MGRVSYFMLDNATSNDTCLDVLLNTLGDVSFKLKCLHCFGHVINLIVKALLFRENADNLS